MEFEEYAGARWAVLFRTALMLTGGRTEAEDLAQTTLVNAFVGWSKVSRADSPDDYVRRMLVNEFISDRRRRGPRTETAPVGVPDLVPVDDPSQRLDLWKQVLALPPRQRAVAVLRFYEDLTELETDLDPGLAELFVSTATDAQVPPLRFHDVLSRGRDLQRLRRRRVVLWTAAAATAVVVVLVALPFALTGGKTDHPAAHQTPTALPSKDTDGVPTVAATLPYLDGRVLHLGGKEIQTEANQLLSHRDTTLVWSTKTRQWWKLRDGNAEQISTARPTNEHPWLGWQSVHLSPDGLTLVVLTHPTATTSRITSYDEATDHERGHVDLDQGYANWTGGGDSVEIAGVNDIGQVFWHQVDQGGDAWWMWGLGDHPVRLAIDLDGAVEFPPAGAIAADGAVVAVSFLGKTTPVGHLPDTEGMHPLWSPSGALVVDGTAGVYATTITRLDGSTAIPPRLPGDFDRWLGFESDTYVLGLVHRDGRARVVRCATDSGACALIAKLPQGSRSWKWATSAPGDPTSQPSPSAPTASSDGTDSGTSASTRPYLSGPLLHAGGRTYKVGTRVNLVTAGATVLLGRWGRRSITWQALRAGRLVALPYGEGAVPVLSPSGKLVTVSTNPTPQTSRITVYDARTDAEVGRADLDLRATCCDGGSVQQLSIDDDGTVHWVEDRGSGKAPEMKWHPGREPVMVRPDIAMP